MAELATLFNSGHLTVELGSLGSLDKLVQVSSRDPSFPLRSHGPQRRFSAPHPRGTHMARTATAGTAAGHMAGQHIWPCGLYRAETSTGYTSSVPSRVGLPILSQRRKLPRALAALRAASQCAQRWRPWWRPDKQQAARFLSTDPHTSMLETPDADLVITARARACRPPFRCCRSPGAATRKKKMSKEKMSKRNKVEEHGDEQDGDGRHEVESSEEGAGHGQAAGQGRGEHSLALRGSPKEELSSMAHVGEAAGERGASAGTGRTAAGAGGGGWMARGRNKGIWRRWGGGG